MARLLSFGFVILVASDFSQSFSSKLDFGEEEESTSVVTNSSKENEDVEVQHTIVVSTKLKNNNRGGFQNTRYVNAESSMQRSGQFQNRKRDDSGEVPVMKGYKALQTTQIHTPDTRIKSPIPAIPLRSNAPDEYDVYPNFATNQMQFKPSNFYNNANWWNQEDTRNHNNFIRRNDATIYSNSKSGFHRSITDDGVKDFYCKKCREMGGGQRCVQQRSNSWRTTTPRIKVDGKIAKLN